MRSIPVLERLSSNNWTDSEEPACYRARCHYVKSTRFDLDGLRYIENREDSEKAAPFPTPANLCVLKTCSVSY